MTDEARLFPGKQFISTVLDALETKTRMTGGLARVFVMRAVMAGAIIGIMYLTEFAVFAAFGESGLEGVGHLVGALFFGFALVFIYYSKSELLTSNMMIVSIGRYHRAISAFRGARVLVLCYLGNIIGGLVIALMVWGSTLASGEIGIQMAGSVDTKLAYVAGGFAGCLDLFIRAMLCNFMINLGMLMIYNGMIKNEVMKALAMISTVFVFAFVGFEHSVANTVLFTIEAFQGGLDWGLALGNLAIVLAGNLVGGGLLIGWYYAYANDSSRHLRKRATSIGA
ncbi:formate/nitrite transporter family protein [Demequina sp. NBRC 110057]|uniref:formate/nitrite transporter family protein n=1 Tax=Demequina sp. NBRC 110057 TaxID=1570346 RepID=UPI000A068454|nr:formate/nitrite transporter family protein [Demequina sp. NBRC 110057]